MKNKLPYRNSIRFNCGNYKRMHAVRPDNCYNCMARDGYPQNLGGDEGCLNFSPMNDALLGRVAPEKLRELMEDVRAIHSPGPSPGEEGP